MGSCWAVAGGEGLAGKQAAMWPRGGTLTGSGGVEVLGPKL